MEQKVRFKLHKVKKQWVTIGVTALSMVAVSATLTDSQKVQADQVTADAESKSGEGAAGLVEIKTSLATENPLDQVSAQTSDASASYRLTDSQATEAVAESPVQTSLETSQVSGQAPVEVAKKEEPEAQTKAQETSASDGQTYDKQVQQSGDLKENQTVEAHQSVAPQQETQKANAQGTSGFRRIGALSTANRRASRPNRSTLTNTRIVNNTETITIRPNNGVNITITATGTRPNVTVITDGNTPKPTVTINNKPATTQAASNNQSVQAIDAGIGQGSQYAANLKTINGKQYYVENGQIKKNFSVEIGGKLYYFGEDGALMNQSQAQYQLGLTTNNSIYARNNQAYNTATSSFESIDNYLTADSWYRPKQILKNGRSWTASTDKDFRPLLMTWWPDKTTQVAYLNYMTKAGLGTKTYASSASQASLNTAAQEVQKRIEERISREGSTAWLRTTMADFVKTQDGWNSVSEDNLTTNKDHLQGGALVYNNSNGKADTSHADSKYRLMNRTPTNQTGVRKYFVDGSVGGYELLLANDIDNSNPAVQAEQLNWLHYIMNIGSILGNDPTANFDGVRIDAVDNVDADLLQIASDYFKEKYGVNNSEADAIKHLSILEAWSYNDHYYNKDTKGAQLSIDNPLRETLLNTFMRDQSVRGSLGRVITNSLNNRASDKKHTPRDANYVFVRAHDSEVQGVLAQIIRE